MTCRTRTCVVLSFHCPPFTTSQPSHLICAVLRKTCSRPQQKFTAKVEMWRPDLRLGTTSCSLLRVLALRLPHSNLRSGRSSIGRRIFESRTQSGQDQLSHLSYCLMPSLRRLECGDRLRRSGGTSFTTHCVVVVLVG